MNVVYLSSLLYIVCGVILVFGCVLVFYFSLLLFWQSGVIDLVVGNSIYLTERRRDNPSFVSDPHFPGSTLCWEIAIYTTRCIQLDSVLNLLCCKILTWFFDLWMIRICPFSWIDFDKWDKWDENCEEIGRRRLTLKSSIRGKRWLVRAIASLNKITNVFVQNWEMYLFK